MKINGITYKLYKEGESFSKPIYFLSEKDFESITEIDQNKISFLTKKNRFIHNPEKHEFHEIKKKKLSKIKFVKPESLYKYEEQEFKKRANEIEENSDFMTLPPIDHRILKILILRKINDRYFLYEVK